MNDLLEQVLAAHGGLDRWQELTTVRATIVTGGELWGLKGLVQDPAPREMTVSLHEERASLQPFGAPDQRTVFTRDRIAIEKIDGEVVAERLDSQASFAGHEVITPMGRVASGLFQRLCVVDLPHHAVLPRDAGLLGHRDRAGGGERREVAGAARDLPHGNREPQHGAGLLLRRGPPAAAA